MLTVNFTPFPLLITQRMVLREVTKSDAQEIFFLRSDKRVMEFLDRPMMQSQQEALELIQKISYALINNDGITWGVTLTNETKLIGTIGYWRMIKEHFRAEIGYMLHPEHQGKGLMQEAMTAVRDHGFMSIKLHSIEANVNPNNAASIRLLENNKFTREAYYKENYYYNGQFLDSAIYSLLTPLR
jgi:[ribosomal protein S5]-alanine N-acetyltransferase